MSAIDIAAIGLIAVGTLHGCFRGLSGELSHFLSVLTAFVFGLWFHHPFAAWLQANTRVGERPAQTLAFAATVVTALTVMLCLRFIFGRIMKVVIEGRFERVCGGLSGFLRSCLLVIILFVLLNLWPNEYLNRKFGDESVIGSFVCSQGPLLGLEGLKAELKKEPAE